LFPLFYSCFWIALTNIQRKEVLCNLRKENVNFEKKQCSVGIIEKQGIQGTILTYIGVVIGFVTAGVLLPSFFTQEQIGVLDVLNAWSMILATLATLGINNVSNRLFPYFRNQANRNNGYLGIVFIVLGIGLLLSIGVFYLIRPYIIEKASETGNLLPKYVDLIIPMTVFTALFLVVDIYFAVIYKSVKGIFHKEVLQRFYILIAILVFVLFIQKFPLFVYLYVAAICLPGITILVSLIRTKEFAVQINKQHYARPLVRNMVSVAFFGIAVAFSNILIQKIDILMIENFMETADVGVYSRTFFYGTLVAIPLRVLAKISAVVTAQAWKENKLQTIKDIYRKSTLDQLIIGSLVLIGLWGNIDNIIRILGPEYEPGKWVVVFIGLSNLFLMAAGVSGAIISTSKDYKVLTLFVGLFGALVIISNLIFIPRFGIQGAAMASALAALFYGLMRYGFLWIKHGMQPYNYRHLVIILFALVAYGINLIIPDLNNSAQPWISLCLDILIRSAAMLISFVMLVWFTKLSPDLNKYIDKIFKKS